MDPEMSLEKIDVDGAIREAAHDALPFVASEAGMDFMPAALDGSGG
jgi:hypothetical protein